ncbi:hypothetical protein K2173_013909 [Erythroxylum novogranatense]|uniref:Calmodulin-binding domain-containing protein n=1 Tax=Erythroxylum novogranatense TaxID=1862640 RepID=A0AAV8SCZ2_9ROSI|nr:hypothetical protein K2173_013909 [Erythroxylum novogranatense]
MAEKSISLPVSPNSNDSNLVNSRRSSLGNLSSSKRGESFLPHYLRASTGSCHDLCKYGRKHEFEEKARRPIRKILKKPSYGQGSLEVQPQRDKTSAVKVKPSAKSSTLATNTPEVIKRELPTKSIGNKISSCNEVLDERTSDEALLAKLVDPKTPLLREVVIKEKKNGLSADFSIDGQSSISNETYDKKKNKQLEQENKKRPVIRRNTSSDLRSHSSKITSKQVLSSPSKKLEVLLHRSSSKAKELNYSSKHTCSISSPSSGKLGVSSRKDFTEDMNFNLNRASSLKLKLSSPGALRVSSAKNNSDVIKTQTTGSSRTSVKKIQAYGRASSSPKSSSGGIAIGPASPRASHRVANLNARKHSSLKVASSLKNRNKLDRLDAEQPKPKSSKADLPKNDEVQEKTLHVIKIETDNKYLGCDCNENISVELSRSPLASPDSHPFPKSPISLNPDEDDEEESDYTVSEAEYDSITDNDEIEHSREGVTYKGENKLGRMKDGTIPPGHKDEQPVKLHFRRGKVVEIQSAHDGPRKLKFRRGRVLGDDQTLKAGARISFRRKVAEGITNEKKSDAEKVTLRHQEDVHRRKDAQGLFNNVIEETASKLVESRKSKVKALVGAFETVIYLQDGKPSPNVGS